MTGGECDRHLDEGKPGFVGEGAEGIGGAEFGGIGWVGGVIGSREALGASGGARPADFLALAVFARTANRRPVGYTS